MNVVFRCVMLLMFPLLVACNLAANTQSRPINQPNNAQLNDQEWSAYLFNASRGELTRVAFDGSATTYTLGLPEGGYANVNDMSFNADGSLLALCQLSYQPDSPLVTATLTVRDVAAQTNVLTVDLGTSAGRTCSLGRWAFNGDRIAVGIMSYIPGDGAADTSQPQWQVIVVSATSGQTLASITAHEHNLDATVFGGIPAMPVLRRFRGDEVIFTFLAFASESPSETIAYAWNLSTGSVQPTNYWGKFGLDVLDTGEMVWVDSDESLPAGQPMGPMDAFNVLRIADGGDPRTLYHGGSEWILSNARFINNGQQVAILLLPTANPNLPESNAIPTRWVALDRAGNVTEIYSASYYGEVMPAPNGYVVLEQDYVNGDFQQGSYTLTYHTGGQSSTLWQTSANGEVWELAWITPMSLASGLSPFLTYTP